MLHRKEHESNRQKREVKGAAHILSFLFVYYNFVMGWFVSHLLTL